MSPGLYVILLKRANFCTGNVFFEIFLDNIVVNMRLTNEFYFIIQIVS